MITVKFVCAKCSAYRGMTLNSKGFMQVGHVDLGSCPTCGATKEYFLHIKETPDADRPAFAGVEVHREPERNELIDCKFLP